MPHLPSRTMPPCTIIPVLVYPDVAEAIAWLSRVFGLKERWRVGNHRAQLSLQEDTIAISEYPEGRPSTIPQRAALHSLLVRVPDLMSHYDHVKSSGAKIIHLPADFPYGEKQYTALDIGGHSWTFSQSLTDMAPEDWGGTRP